MAFDKVKSKTVLVVYFYDKNGEGRKFYSDFHRDDKIGWNKTAKDMIKRLVNGMWKGKIERYMLYKNDDSGQMLQFWKAGKLIIDEL